MVKNFLINKINFNAMKYDFEISDRVAMSVAPHSGKIYVMSKEIFKHPQKVVFEGVEFNAPCNYDEFLTIVYGNYMELPPVEKRKTHHKNLVYWKKIMD
jgi:lipopolysaccharide cholinephosphotransferase